MSVSKWDSSMTSPSAIVITKDQVEGSTPRRHVSGAVRIIDNLD